MGFELRVVISIVGRRGPVFLNSLLVLGLDEYVPPILELVRDLQLWHWPLERFGSLVSWSIMLPLGIPAIEPMVCETII